MRYKVEFENNIAVRAHPVRSANRTESLTDFDDQDGKIFIRYLYVEAENEEDALQQAARIVQTVFKF